MDQRGCDVPPAATALRQRRKEEARLGVRLAAGIDRYCPLPSWPVGRMYDPRPQRPFVGRCGQPIGRWGSRRGVCGFPVASPALHDTLASTRPRRRGTEAAPGASESTKPTNGCRDRSPSCHSKREGGLLALTDATRTYARRAPASPFWHSIRPWYSRALARRAGSGGRLYRVVIREYCRRGSVNRDWNVSAWRSRRPGVVSN